MDGMILNLLVPKNVENLLTNCGTINFICRNLSHGVVIDVVVVVVVGSGGGGGGGGDMSMKRNVTN
jgi:hypothetical protein